MDFIKIVNEAFATGKEHPSFRSGDTTTASAKVARNVSSATVVSSSASAVTATRSASPYARSLKV